MARIALSRRQFNSLLTSSLVGASLGSRGAFASEKRLNFPVRTITRGPKYHWFGYYDKLEFDPTEKLVLSNQVDFEHRSPTADDVLKIGMIDTAHNDQWVELGQSRSWGWQQGCMLQWIPGSKSEIIWNDREDDHFVAHILDVQSGKKRTIDRAIYTLSPDGKYGYATDFARIQNHRPGYGYPGVKEPYRDQHAPEELGIWRIDLSTGESKLIFSIAQAAAVPYPDGDLSTKWHWFNHLLCNTDGTRLIFLSRWRDHRVGDPDYQYKQPFYTRVFTIGTDGSDLHLLENSGHFSHFIWRDPDHIAAWSTHNGGKNYWLYTDQTDQADPMLPEVMTWDAHLTYLPWEFPNWILNDSYPRESERFQIPHLVHLPTGRKVELGRFPSPKEYTGEWRCDTHPRSSPSGRLVAIDSPHTGGRQVHLIDLSALMDA